MVNDFAEVVRAAKALVLSKNSGDLLQDFVYQTSNFDTKSVSSVSTPVDKDKAKRDGNEAAEGLRTLGRLILTNGQFRKLRKFVCLSRDGESLALVLTCHSQGCYCSAPRHGRRCRH